MTTKELLKKDGKIEPTLQYKLTHQWMAVYFCVIGMLLAALIILMKIDEERFLPVEIGILVLIGLIIVGYLAAMVVVRKKVLSNPEVKDGAKHPARIPISAAKYKELRRQIAHTTLEKGRLDAYRFFFADQLMNGDLQPAVVCSVKPFTVAVYSDEFDGTLLLLFPDRLAEAYRLREGDRLVSVVSYFETPFARQGLQKDVFPGPQQTGRWNDLLPVLPLFLTGDAALLAAKANELDAALWDRAISRIEQHCADFAAFTRDGFWFTHLSSEDWDRSPIYEAQR